MHKKQCSQQEGHLFAYKCQNTKPEFYQQYSKSYEIPVHNAIQQMLHKSARWLQAQQKNHQSDNC